MRASSGSGDLVGLRRPRRGHVAKRWLYVVHRWIGIASCLLFAMWFVSGLVMIYVPFPSLTPGERLAGLPPIAFDRVLVQPGQAAQAADIPIPAAVSLEMEATLPVWRVSGWEGEEVAVSAEDGRVQAPVGMEAATATATAFGGRPVTTIEPIERDQWTVAGGYDRHRPLWKASLAGPEGRVLYVSSRTGAVVLDTDARERFWNWLGSVPHWLYPTVLRQDNAAWRQVVMWVSGPCILGAVTGLWVGLLRVRLGRRRFGGGRAIPYTGWTAWHHVAGLFGGVALTAWIFSGWLSVDPFRLFASPGVTTPARIAYAGAGRPPVLDLGRLASAAHATRRVEFGWAASHPSLMLEAPGAPERLLDARTLAPLRLAPAELIARGRRLLPGAPLVAVDRLTRPDAYWYEVGETPTLPMLRLRFGDPARTWLHIDPATGRFAGQLDRRRRVYRWAFDFLHKWDLNGLTLRRPLWDIVLWLLSAAGLVTSATGIWIGWRRLSRRRWKRTASGGRRSVSAVLD